MKVPTERLTEVLSTMGTFAGMRTISFKVEDARAILSELLELREAVRKAWRIVDEVLIGPDPDEALASLIDVLKAASAPNPVDEVQP